MTNFDGIDGVSRAFMGKRVLITGHTGFKGSWLSLWLASWGAEVHGVALPPVSPGLFEAARLEPLLHGHHILDLRDRDRVEDVVDAVDPEVVFHLAAQPIVLESYRRPAETFDTNVMGTVNLLEAIRRRGRPCAVVVVTSDKCYGGICPKGGYREEHRFGGADPYSASKGAAELIAASYRQSFFAPDKLDEHGVQLATARAGNVIGGGDWAPHRIVPDLVAALVAEEPVVLRHPGAIRPWQHVLDPLFGYASIAANMLVGPSREWCEGFNFGPGPQAEVPVHELVDQFVDAWHDEPSPCFWRPEHPEVEVLYESPTLRLNVDKVRHQLGLSAAFDAAATIERTAWWYRDHLVAPESARQLCLNDIIAYEAELLPLPEVEAAPPTWRTGAHV